MPTPFEPRRFGAYQLEARLGHGGMAEVFRASRSGVAGFERICVIKRILANHNDDPSFVDMFINEAKIAAKLTHPNIVQVYELGQVEGEFFIAMEYVKGKDLLRILRELAQTRQVDPAIPQALCAYIARETCRALQHAHDHTDERGQARPIIHRDVSPQNIMISSDGLVKLVDFGIAKALGSMREETRTGALKGKFAYMAPEQISSQNPGPQADIFATGVVLHEMLTGRRLFKGPTDYDTLSKVRSMEVPHPASIDPRISLEVDAIVMKALERDRSARYDKASAMARDLDIFLQSQRFSAEDMAEFMRELFPPVEPGASTGERTREYLVRRDPSESVNSANREATPITGAGALARGSHPGSRTDVTPSGSGGQRTLFIALGLSLLVGTGAIFLVRGRGAPEPSMATEQLPAARAGTGKAAPEVLQMSPEVRTVRVISEPPSARVYEGPRLLGQAPLELKLPVDSPGVTLTLVHAGRSDLTYLVRPADAPELTLRMAQTGEDPLAPRPAVPATRPVLGKPVAAKPAPPVRTPPHAASSLQKPHVEIFEEGSE